MILRRGFLQSDKEVMKSVLRKSVFLLLPALGLGAVNTSFSPLDLSADDKLLFMSEVEQPGWDRYRALMSADLSGGDDIRLLTHFPERASYYPNTGELEIHNRYGLYRGRVEPFTRFSELPFHPSFSEGTAIVPGSILPTVPSPDGKWILVQEPEGPVRGSLVLYSTVTGTVAPLSSGHALDYRNAPALWSPDSSYLIYSRNEKLYYLAIRHVEEGRVPDESYREFGEGTLSSVRWAGPDALFHVSGSLASLIRTSEFTARSFYADPLPIGNTLGRIPVEFDAQFDIFWPAPDRRSILLLKNRRNLFRIPLDRIESEGADGLTLPFLLLPPATTVLQLWWRGNGSVVILAGGSRRSEGPSLFYVLDVGDSERAQFVQHPLPELRRFVPSANGRTLALIENEGVSLRNADTLEEKEFINHPDPRNLFWLDPDSLLIVGAHRMETVDLVDDTVSLVGLSAAEEAGYDAAGEILAVSDGRHYRWSPANKTWSEAEGGSGAIRTPRLESRSHRVYGEAPKSSYYRNQIMVRKVSGFGNRPLFPAPALRRVPLPDSGDDTLPSAFDSRVFDHGSRTRRREISLVFNAIDDDDGLGYVLSLLADHGIRATFFVGGDFIRRNPESARTLASSGHELGNLFYTHMDMTDYRYRIDSEFVVRGMGRNEDEFFEETDSEVSTLWHSPWYVVSPAILNATERMNYLYVGRDVDPLDWVTLDARKETRDLYKPSAELVERLLDEVRPGSIVPIRIGKPGKRDDFFFQKLDLLINGLLKDGYAIVTAGELKENSL